ncbi:MAG: YicC family protein [Desulfovibrio sp.]|nr:YicC family protein [Desulfovibrio sp.]
MLRSMTGFGRCLVENDHGTQQWEIKSVNGRHLDIKWHLPCSVRNMELRLEKIVRKHASRGRIDITLTLQYAQGIHPDVHFDVTQAIAMIDCLKKLADGQGHSFKPDYNALLHIPTLWNDSNEELSENIARELEEGLALAIEDWDEARIAEGRALSTDMHSRLLRMEEWTGFIAERASILKEERTEALRERLNEGLAQFGQELDESRFLQEIVILADRLDVTEEITRLGTHLAHLHDLLQSGKDAGRRLDFTLQECFREINTCGNKLPDVQLSRTVVDFKNELEKCREQVQNLE